LVFAILLIADRSGIRADQPEWKPLFDGKTLHGWHEFGS
jgi:hypothetical protein